MIWFRNLRTETKSRNRPAVPSLCCEVQRRQRTHLPRVARRPPGIHGALTIFHHKFPVIQRHVIMEQGGHRINYALAEADGVEYITLQWIVRDPPEIRLALPWSHPTADLREYRDLLRETRTSRRRVWVRAPYVFLCVARIYATASRLEHALIAKVPPPGRIAPCISGSLPPQTERSAQRSATLLRRPAA